MRETAIGIVLAFVASGCNTGTAASPVFTSSPAEGDGGGAEAGYAVCPEGMTATFDSIYKQMLSTTSCGSTLNTCHSTTAAKTINGLDYSLDEQGVYLELLGDGGGVVSDNIAGTAMGVRRVAPGDAGASMLYIKLTLDSGTNPQYGSGMPQSDPGSVCPAAIAAVGTWINGGASLDGGAPLEAGGPLDASGDGDAGGTVDATLD